MESPDYVPPQAQPEPGAQPPADPAADAPAPAQSPELAAANARAEAFREMALQRQPEPDAAPAPVQQQAPLPTNPLDLLSPAERDALKLKRISDPEAYEGEIATLATRLAEMRVTRAAAPMIAGQASLIVSNFRQRMASADSAYGADTAPIFDKAIAALGAGISNLVGMQPAQQDAELKMRWDQAKLQVMDVRMKNPPKPEPQPLGGGGVSTPNNDETDYFKTDPLIAALGRRYKFTDAQKALINAGTL